MGSGCGNLNTPVSCRALSGGPAGFRLCRFMRKTRSAGNPAHYRLEIGAERFVALPGRGGRHSPGVVCPPATMRTARRPPLKFFGTGLRQGLPMTQPATVMFVAICDGHLVRQRLAATEASSPDLSGWRFEERGLGNKAPFSFLYTQNHV